MLFFSKIDFNIYGKFYKIIYFAGLILLIAVKIPGLGYSANGATRWLNLGFTTIQPSELVKVGLIIFYATYLSKHKDELKDIKNGFIKPLLYLLPVIAILFFVQNHLSASIVIIAITAIMMLMAGTKLRYFITSGVLGIGALGSAFFIMAQKATAASEASGGFRLARITSFLDPWQDAQGAGWQIIQSLYAIGSGGLFGTGLGNSTQKYLYIPEPHNDFIFSILAEELGFVGCVFVILLFIVFIWRGIVIAMKAPNLSGSLIAVGITAQVGIQAIINIAVVTSSIPNTGMPLPFFSYGGTALLILLCSVGVLLNISRQGNKV